MIAVRRYVFAFVAVCAAFAAGIALGNGPLQGDRSPGTGLSLSNADARMGDQVQRLRQDLAVADAAAKVAGPALVHNKLDTVSVAVVVLPGVVRPTVMAVSRAVTAAGGEVSVLARVGPTLVDPAKKTYVDSVATNSLKGVKDLAAAARGSTYQRIGALLARAYTGSSDSLAVDDEATRIDAQLQGAKLVSLAGPLQRRASGVVVLAPPQHGTGQAAYAEHQIELQVIEALAAHSDGVVVAAGQAAGRPGGLLAEVTASKLVTHAVSTVNVLDTAYGQTVVVAALAAEISGHPGSYGLHGGRVVLPPGFGR